MTADARLTRAREDYPSNVAAIVDQRDRFRKLLGDAWVLLNSQSELAARLREALDEEPALLDATVLALPGAALAAVNLRATTPAGRLALVTFLLSPTDENGDALPPFISRDDAWTLLELPDAP